MTAPHPDARFIGLSCYTSNLACYLAAEFAQAGQLLADSVRLAVRTDLPRGRLAFSHHRYPLDLLPDGSRLRWACSDPADVVAELCGELDGRGSVLVLTDIAALPWSPSFRAGAAAPHLLLVDGRRNDAWHVVDAFSGLLATGEQAPYAGWMTTGMLLAAMTPSDRWTAVQHTRNRLAFGFAVPVPGGERLRWLRREAVGGAGPELRGDWLLDDARVLPFLADYVVAQGARAEPHLDDIWTAARHRAFRHRWQRDAPGLRDDDRVQLETAAEAWERLPQALRFAVDSARRGRPRDALVHKTFSHVLVHELALRRTDRSIHHTPMAGRNAR